MEEKVCPIKKKKRSVPPSPIHHPTPQTLYIFNKIWATRVCRMLIKVNLHSKSISIANVKMICIKVFRYAKVRPNLIY